MQKGKRIKLMPLEKKHIDLFLKWFNDPEIARSIKLIGKIDHVLAGLRLVRKTIRIKDTVQKQWNY